MPESEVILAEYKHNGYNLASAIAVVNDRNARIAEEKNAIEQVKRNKGIEEKATQQVKEAFEEALEQPVVVDTKELALKFTVYGTREKLRELKKFLDDGGYRYE